MEIRTSDGIYYFALGRIFKETNESPGMQLREDCDHPADLCLVDPGNVAFCELKLVCANVINICRP